MTRLPRTTRFFPKMKVRGARGRDRAVADTIARRVDEHLARLRNFATALSSAGAHAPIAVAGLSLAFGLGLRIAVEREEQQNMTRGIE
jgi:hypothetical protein